jgi:asparagine synthase (glutamine-hydrolysing)
MCGIVGFLSRKNDNDIETRIGRLERMAARISHRGPDDTGFWAHPDLNVNLGFRRLAILDLTPAGHQPMQSSERRFTLIYNGEIYNYRELRNQLLSLGHSFRGHSDTEVALASFREWGIASSVRRFAGMFAMAIWDESERELTLVRDRFGKKPLYYGWQNGTFLFASELKAFAGDADFGGHLNNDVLASYLALSYVPAPDSIFSGISKLESATILRLRFDHNEVAKERYWDYRSHFSPGVRSKARPDDQTLESEARGLLEQCVAERMVADVPIGAFLSGGIDSSLVVATMQKLSSLPVQTFTIGFREESFDEASYARSVAAHLGTDHHELYVTPVEAQAALERMSMIYDEPFADSSQLPTYLVAALARERVTVVLTGDGGDEMFGGYNRYVIGKRLSALFSCMPLTLRASFSRILTFASPTAWDRMIPVQFAGTVNGDRIHKLAALLPAHSVEEAYKNLLGYRHAAQLLRQPAAFRGVLSDDFHFDQGLPIVSNMMLLDALTYLTDDILAKVDRATMAVSLEARCPFLDHRMAEWAARVPLEHKVTGSHGKLLLRRLLRSSLPESLIDRPKMGVGVPLAAWLRGPLRSWAEDILRRIDGRDEDIFDREAVLRLWSEHQRGVRNWQTILWNFLVLSDWLHNWKAVPRVLQPRLELAPTRP